MENLCTYVITSWSLEEKGKYDRRQEPRVGGINFQLTEGVPVYRNWFDSSQEVGLPTELGTTKGREGLWFGNDGRRVLLLSRDSGFAIFWLTDKMTTPNSVLGVQRSSDCTVSARGIRGLCGTQQLTLSESAPTPSERSMPASDHEEWMPCGSSLHNQFVVSPRFLSLQPVTAASNFQLLSLLLQLFVTSESVWDRSAHRSILETAVEYPIQDFQQLLCVSPLSNGQLQWRFRRRRLSFVAHSR